MTGFTYTEVLIINSVLVESIPEGLDTSIEHTLLLGAALSYEQIIHLVIGFRVIEESSEGLLRSGVTCTEDAEVCKEIERLQTYEYCVTATHRETGNGTAMRVRDGLVVTVDEGDDGLAILTFHNVESEFGMLRMIAMNDLIVHKRNQHRFCLSFCKQIVHYEIDTSVIHPV